MTKSLVVAAALTLGLTGYALAQNTVTGAPAGTAPMTPEPVMRMHHPMRNTKHHRTHKPKHHDAAAPMAAPTDAPK
jgi:hypothetical protein